MLDFGTLLPFNYVQVPDEHCFWAFYMQLHQEKTVHVRGQLVQYPEQWAYFVWLPQTCGPMRLKAPDGWGIVNEVPHEYLFVEIRREPVYFLPWWQDIGQWLLIDFLLEHGDCPTWLQRQLGLLRAQHEESPRLMDVGFERFVQTVVRAPTWR
jgi:hypothetical protein